MFLSPRNLIVFHPLSPFLLSRSQSPHPDPPQIISYSYRGGVWIFSGTTQLMRDLTSTNQKDKISTRFDRLVGFQRSVEHALLTKT